MKIIKGMLVIKWTAWMEFWGKLFNASYGAQAFLGLPLMFYKADRNLSDKTINHEKIHLRQGVELLWIGLWILYGGHWLINFLFKSMSADEAYRNVIFEKEAYDNQHDLDYLKTRKFWAWTKYWKK